MKSDKLSKLAIAVAILVIFAGIFYSCENEMPDIEEGLLLQAKVEDASVYNNVVEVKLMIFVVGINNYVEIARGKWEGDGFAMVLPETIAVKYLDVSGYNRGLLEPIIDPSLAMTISNRNAKAGTAYFWGIDKRGNVVASFYPFKINEEGSADEAFYSYVDSEVAIFGNNENERVQDFEIDGFKYIALVKTTTIYSVELKMGWNLWWLSNVIDEQEFAIKNEWSTVPIDKLKWVGAPF